MSPAAVMARRRHVPVTVVCGPHRAGKSSLIGHLQTGPRSTGIQAISSSVGEHSPTQPASDALWARVEALAQRERPDHLLIEARGGEEPRLFAEALGGDPAGAGRRVARLDTLVTVLDATNLLSLCGPCRSSAADARSLVRDIVPGPADIVVEQFEFADVLVVNKVDLVGENERWAIEALLRLLNPGASILRGC